MAITKKTTTTTVTAPAAAPSTAAPVEAKKPTKVAEVASVPTPVVTPVPVASKAVASKKKPTTTASVVVEAVSVPEVTAEPVVASETVLDDKVTGENLISSVVEKVAALSGQVKDIQSALKLLVKEHEKQQKIIEKVQKKRENARKSPSGFAKPNKISDELCDFIGVPHGTEKSRTEVTRFINAYVKEHNLNNPKNRRVIIPDDKLKSILNVKDDEEVTFFILQRLISHHFPLSISKLNAAAAVANAAVAAQ